MRPFAIHFRQVVDGGQRCWQRIRQLSGDDAYERYLAHYAEQHAGQPDAHPPLTRGEFFRQWQDQKWQGVKRCC